MTRRCTSDLIAEDALPPEKPVRSTRARRSGYLPIAGRVAYALDPEWIVARRRAGRRRAKTYVEFEGRTAYRRALAHSVSRHQPRLAGERSRARRHHDGVRRADRRGADRRPRRVRRRDARRVHAAADRGPLHRRRHARLGHVWGSGTADLVIENSYVDVTKSVITTASREITRRRAVLARLPAQGRRRGDQRPHQRSRGGRSRTCATRSSSTTTRSKACLGRVPPLRQRTRRRSASAGCIIDKGTAYGETFDTRRRRCGSRAPASGSTASTSGRAPAPSPAPRGSAGTATTRSTRTAPGSRSNRSTTASFPRAPLSGCCSSTPPAPARSRSPRYDVQAPRGRPVRRRRRHRPGHRAAVAARRAADDGARRRVPAARRCRGSGRIALTPEMDAELTLRFCEHVARSVPPLLRAAAVAVHDRRRRRHDPRRRRARRRRSSGRRGDASSSSS